MDQGQGFEALQEQLKRLQATVDENQALLQSIQRRAKLAILFSSLKWLIIIGISFGSFYFIQPYLETMLNTYKSIGSGAIIDFQNIIN